MNAPANPLVSSATNVQKLNRRELLCLSAAALTPGPLRVDLSGLPFEVLHHGQSPNRYVLLHGDEATARKVLTEQMERRAGIAHLIVSSKRMVEIHGLTLDPNRIFSDEGALKTLRRENPNAPRESIDSLVIWLREHRQELMHALLPGKGGRLFALHNNSRGYNLEDEVAGSDETSLPMRARTREFFLVTDPNDFSVLKQSPFNVLLQHTLRGEEDGSLSRYSAVHNIRYINLECALGNEEAQHRMVDWLEQNLA